MRHAHTAHGPPRSQARPTMARWTALRSPRSPMELHDIRKDDPAVTNTRFRLPLWRTRRTDSRKEEPTVADTDVTSQSQATEGAQAQLPETVVTETAAAGSPAGQHA